MAQRPWLLFFMVFAGSVLHCVEAFEARDADDVSFLQQGLQMDQHDADHLSGTSSWQVDFDISSPEYVPAAASFTKDLVAHKWQLKVLDPGAPDSDYYVGSVDIQHVSKCGGTFVGHVANASLRDFSYYEWDTNNEITTFQPSPQVFSIGLIRNPFDWLVSLWSFNGPMYATGEFPIYLHSLDVRRDPPLPAGTTEVDRIRFRKWVHYVSDEKVGLMSLNYYGKYLRNETLYPGPEWHRLTAPHFLAKYPRAPLEDALAHDPLPPIDCWARTETLEADTRSCFKLYEERAGPGSVDWAAFNESTETAYKNEMKHGHVDCYLMFDDELAAFVNASESTVLRMFNYSRCQPH